MLKIVRAVFVASFTAFLAALSVVSFAESEPCGKECVKQIREAAESGDVNAQFDLGVIYEGGKGEVRDVRKAVRWFRKAAEQGLPEAQYNLGLMYAKGEGVVEDMSEAYVWLLIAKASGEEKAGSELQKIRDQLSPLWLEGGKFEAKSRFEKIENRRSSREHSETTTTKKAALEKKKNAERLKLAEERAARVAYSGDLKSGYINRIIGRIEDYLITPPAAKETPNVRVVVEVDLDINGTIQGSPRVVDSSGIPEYDNAVVRAVLQASPLPMPKDEELIEEFRQLRLHISPR